MGFWVSFFLWLGAQILYELIRPKPDIEDARPATLGDFTFPTATEGRPVPLVWGTVKIKGPNVVWFGDLRKRAIVEEVKTGLFSSDDVVVGYRYSVAIQCALCRGTVDRLNRIWLDERVAVDTPIVGAGSATFTDDEFFGGDDLGSGGVDLTFTFATGAPDQAVNGYLATQQTPQTPAYRGTCYVIADGYIGNSAQVAPLAFEVRRIPDPLSLASLQPGDELVNGADANPANVLVEVMTNTEWGLGHSITAFDLPSFRTAAATLADEGNGVSWLLDSPRSASEILGELERQVDGVVYQDRFTGLFRLKLIRADYVVGNLPLFDESNVVELATFARGTWEETTNQVRARFSNRDNEYEESFAVAQDIANVQIQAANVPSEITLPGVKDATLANAIAWRELATLAYPLSKIQIRTNRDGYALNPGDAFRFTRTAAGVSETVFRATRIQPGDPSAESCIVDAVEDVFGLGIPAFANAPGSSWSEPGGPAAAISAADSLILEAPSQFLANPALFPYRAFWVGARNPPTGTVRARVFWRSGTTNPSAGAYTEDTTVHRFLQRGTLKTAIPQIPSRCSAAGILDPTLREPNFAQNFTVEDGPDTGIADELVALANGVQGVRLSEALVLIGNEIIGFESASKVGADAVVTGLRRALFDTVLEAHSIGDPVWLLTLGGSSNVNEIPYDHGFVDVQLRTQTARELLAEGDATTLELAMSSPPRSFRPAAPKDVTVQYGTGSKGFYPSSVDLDVLLGASSLPGADDQAGHDLAGVDLFSVGRDWRNRNPTEEGFHSHEWLNFDGPYYEFRLYKDPDTTPALILTLTTPVAANPAHRLLRNALYQAGAGVIPSRLRLDVVAFHSAYGSYSPAVKQSLFTLSHTFDVTTELASYDFQFGNKASGAAWSAPWTVPESGTYGFTLGKALDSSGTVTIRRNGATQYTAIVAGAASGTSVVAFTAGDTMEIQHSHGAGGTPRFLLIEGPTGTPAVSAGALLLPA